MTFSLDLFTLIPVNIFNESASITWTLEDIAKYHLVSISGTKRSIESS